MRRAGAASILVTGGVELLVIVVVSVDSCLGPVSGFGLTRLASGDGGAEVGDMAR